MNSTFFYTNLKNPPAKSPARVFTKIIFPIRFIVELVMKDDLTIYGYADEKIF